MLRLGILNGIPRRGLGLSIRFFGKGPKYMSKPDSKYRRTLNLPKVSSFPLSMKDGVSAKRELEIQRSLDLQSRFMLREEHHIRGANVFTTCNFEELYKWQQAEARDKEFVLHDGPPYANGSPHVGHALNKILKDITNRYKVMRGYKVHYTPGWDCHGLPIELKALQNLRTTHTEMEPLDIRKRAHNFAKKTINIQRAAFKRWGVMADWDNCYYTFDKTYEAAQLEVFFSMYEKGFIYQDYMPVYWSPSSRTALAEAELEYNDNHESTAVYVKCPLVQIPGSIQQLGGSTNQCWAVVWTTTPWTLPANRAICYGSNIEYCILRDLQTSDQYLVSTEFKDTFEGLLGRKVENLGTIKGSDLAGASYRHPLYDDLELPLLPADHVTVAKGTGLVHTAPAHGPEDFQVAVRHGLSKECQVDEDGRYTSEVGLGLSGRHVIDEGTEAVLSRLGEHAVHIEKFTHSYPYDWRTKKPVILRASRQWFVDAQQIAGPAAGCLQGVLISPRHAAKGMDAQLERRTYWCISRQRVWGVPIPIFYHGADATPVITRASIDHIKKLVLEHGTDCWWTLPREELLPAAVLEQSGLDPSDMYSRGDDVLDIWFDSGTSWAAVLDNKTADVYMEGLDQFGGWFQSSLLTSVAARGQAPYKSLVVHGFTVDEEGKKMSKSVGNVVDPQEIINGGKDRQKLPAYGADVLRWWVAQAGLESNVNIGPSVIQSCHEQVFRIRKALRYLMGNVADFEPEEHWVEYKHLLPQDQYMLHLLHHFCQQVTAAYEDFNYSQAMELTEKFVSSHVSGFHCHVTKDRLYCSSADSPYRRSGQTVQHAVLQVLVRVIAPVLPHLAEEAHLVLHPLFTTDCDSVFKRRWFEADPVWHNPDLAASFDIVFRMKETFNIAIASDNPVQFDVVICAKPLIYEKIKILQEEQTSSTSALAEVLQCSHTSLLARPPVVIPDESQPVEGHCPIVMADGREEEHKFMLVLLPPEKSLCARCRRQTAPHRQALCERCSEVLADGWDM